MICIAFCYFCKADKICRHIYAHYIAYISKSLYIPYAFVDLSIITKCIGAAFEFLILTRRFNTSIK